MTPTFDFPFSKLILVGDVPFFGNDQMEVFIKILTKQPDYPEYVDNQSKMVIDGLLEKEPKRRFSAGMFFLDNRFLSLVVQFWSRKVLSEEFESGSKRQLDTWSLISAKKILDKSPKFMNTSQIEVMVEFQVVPMYFFDPDS